MINQAHINKGEPHWTPEGRAAIEKLVRAAFGDNVTYVPSHHVAFTVGEEIFEMASLETFLFNHGVAQRLFGDGYLETLGKLAQVPELERLAWLNEREVEWNHGQNQKT